MVSGVPVGTPSLGWVSLIHLCSGFSSVATPLKMAHLRLLDSLKDVQGDLVGIWCGAARAGFVAVEPSAVISAMMSSKLFFSVVVRVTPVAAASSSASISSRSSSDLSLSKTFLYPCWRGLGLGAQHLASPLTRYHHLGWCVFVFVWEAPIEVPPYFSSFRPHSFSSPSELSISDSAPSASFGAGWSSSPNSNSSSLVAAWVAGASSSAGWKLNYCNKCLESLCFCFLCRRQIDIGGPLSASSRSRTDYSLSTAPLHTEWYCHLALVISFQPQWPSLLLLQQWALVVLQPIHQQFFLWFEQ